MALYYSALVTKIFNNSRKLFYVKIMAVKLKASLFLNASLHIPLLTLLTEALHLVSTVGCSFRS